MRIKCWTLFDITITGVRSNFNQNRMPFPDSRGQIIDSSDTWHRARNQQRNWETINQLLSLRFTPQDITEPKRVSHGDVNVWEFEFEVDNPPAIYLDDSAFGALTQDCCGVPMLVGLDETPGQISLLEPGRNIGFEVVNP